ncbi:hypothetical protein DXG03_002111 [Asterophora parasitica]|uniref:Uncharacterized protein n=1 Tax=Asterophora parasitica TaxID=117018 RepID=A0A9P7G8T2_9AGAR|nr:hypothetical protein DXG03_002111 [Asterophora parasitica]
MFPSSPLTARPIPTTTPAPSRSHLPRLSRSILYISVHPQPLHLLVLGTPGVLDVAPAPTRSPRGAPPGKLNATGEVCYTRNPQHPVVATHESLLCVHGVGVTHISLPSSSTLIYKLQAPHPPCASDRPRQHPPQTYKTTPATAEQTTNGRSSTVAVANAGGVEVVMEREWPNKPLSLTISLLNYLTPRTPSGMASTPKLPPKGPPGAGTPGPTRHHQPRSDISELLTAETGPVKTVRDARSWLEQKGWVLASDPYDREKMVHVLLTAALALPGRTTEARAEARTAVLAVALLLEDNIGPGPRGTPTRTPENRHTESTAGVLPTNPLQKLYMCCHPEWWNETSKQGARTQSDGRPASPSPGGGKTASKPGTTQRGTTGVMGPKPVGHGVQTRQTRWTPPDALNNDDVVTDICDVEDGRAYLEKHLLLVPSGSAITAKRMAAVLFQIAALSGVSRPAVNAIMASAYILEDLEKEGIEAEFKETIDVKLQETVGMMEEMAKTMATAEAIGKITEKIEAQTTAPLPTGSYVAALRRAAAPLTVDPRIKAKEGIKARQFMFVVDEERKAELRALSSEELTQKFNNAVKEVGHTFASVVRMRNGDLLAETVTDEGAD